jgi:hypothetical protein
MREILVFAAVLLFTGFAVEGIQRLNKRYDYLLKQYNICMDLHEPGVSAVPVD